MNFKLLALPALLLSLSACGPQGVSVAPASEWVRVPALPLVQEAVRSLSPTFNGKRIPVLIDHLCSLSQGQMSQEQSDSQLARIGIDADKLPRESEDAIALLVNGDRVGQTTACAAAQASAALTPLNPADVLRSSSSGRTGSGETAGSPKREVDQVILGRLLTLKAAQARTDADFFAIIAARLSASPGLTESEYRSQAQAIFREIAPRYLDRLKQQSSGQDIRYNLERLENDRLAFSSNAGVRYSLSAADGLIVTHYGQLWYGRGKLLGMDYSLQVSRLGQPELPARKR